MSSEESSTPSLSFRPDTASAEIWTLSRVTSAFGLVGLILFGFLRLAYSLFYSRFGVTPEELGFGHAEILAQSVVGVIVVFVAQYLFVELLGSLFRDVGKRLKEVRAWLDRIRRVYGVLAMLVVVVLQIGGLVFFFAPFVAPPRVRGVVFLAVFLSWGLDPHPQKGESGEARSEAARSLSQWLQETVAGLRSVFHTLRYRAAHLLETLPRWWSARRWAVAVAVVVSAVLVCWRSTVDASAVKRGESRRGQMYGLPFPTWGGEVAEVSWLSGSPPKGMTDACRLMFLGQNGGVTFLYDVESERTLRIPSGAITIAVHSGGAASLTPPSPP